jgi:hypothetical protein
MICPNYFLKLLSFFIIMYLFVYWVTAGKLSFWENFFIVFFASLFIPVCDITQDIYLTQNINVDIDAYLSANPQILKMYPNDPSVKQYLKKNKKIYKKDPSLFMWANNPSKPECCVSGMGNTYYTSHGCICYTDEQLKQLSSRGNNMDPSCRSYI